MNRLLARQLEETVQRAARVLGEFDEAVARTSPAPGKWSPKQVLGHLIDSAIVNHQRFAQATSPAELAFETYDQEHFVVLQDPGGVPLAELLELWRLLNLHIARVVDHASDEAFARLLPEENLERVAWKPPEPGEPATFEYFIRDYIGHMVHHLGQIDPSLA